MKLLNLIAALFRTVRDAWRDIKELSRPYSYSDVNWNQQPWRVQDEIPAGTVTTNQYNYARFGKCDYCCEEVWYKIIYTSAGIPVAVLLCCRCAWDMVQASPHIQVIHITSARDKWCREQWTKDEE